MSQQFLEPVQPVSDSQSNLLQQDIQPEGGTFGDWAVSKFRGVNNSLVDWMTAKTREMNDPLNAGKKIKGYDAQRMYPNGKFDATKEYTMAEAQIHNENVLNRQYKDLVGQRQNRGFVSDFASEVAAEIIGDPVSTAGYIGASFLGGAGIAAAAARGSTIARALIAAQKARPILYGIGSEAVENVAQSLAINSFRNEFLTSVTPQQDYTGTDFMWDVTVGAGVGAFGGIIADRLKRRLPIKNTEINPAEAVSKSFNYSNETSLLDENIRLSSEYKNINYEDQPYNRRYNAIYDDGYGAKIEAERDIYNPLLKTDLNSFNAREIEATMFVNPRESSFGPYGRSMTFTAQPLYGSAPDLRRISAKLVSPYTQINYDTAMFAAVKQKADLSPNAQALTEYLDKQFSEMADRNEMPIGKMLSDLQNNMKNLVLEGKINQADAESIMDGIHDYFSYKGIDGISDGKEIHVFDTALRSEKNKAFETDGNLSTYSQEEWQSLMPYEAWDQLGGSKELVPVNEDPFNIEKVKADFDNFIQRGQYSSPNGTIAFDPVTNKFVSNYHTKAYDIAKPIDYTMDIPENVIKRYDENLTQFASDIDAEFTVVSDNIDMLLKNAKLQDKYFKLVNALDDADELRKILDDKDIDIEFEKHTELDAFKEARKEAMQIKKSDLSPAQQKKAQKDLEKRAAEWDKKYAKKLIELQKERLQVLELFDENATNIMKYERDAYMEIKNTIKEGKELIKNQEKVLRAFTICMFKGK